MAKKKSSGQREGISFWQPTTDLMTALVLLLLLIILLLVLYLIQVPDSEILNQWLQSTWNGTVEETDDATLPTDPLGVDDREGYGEGDADNEEDGHHYDYATRGGGGGGGAGGEGDGNYREGGYEYDTTAKSAVLVTLTDGETGIRIQVPDIAFRLYNANDRIMALYSYYPEKTEYTRYATTEDGSFYLPEKLPLGSYSLSQLTDLTGYDRAENTEFALDEERDWDEPYRVTVKVYPSRNTIRFRLTDFSTGEPVSGAQVRIYAAENITTADGTVRCTAGELLQTVTSSADGTGESAELYLGSYQLQMTGDGTFYADSDLTEAFSLEKKSDTAPVQEITCDKTAVTVTLRDEHTGEALREGTFLLTDDAGTRSEVLSVDENGKIRITNLRRNSFWQLRQTGAAADYRYSADPLTFTVSADGRIDGSAEAAYTVENRLLRVSLNAENMFIGGDVTGAELALYGDSDEPLETWTTAGKAHTVTGLEPGTYTLRAEGTFGGEMTVEVKDTAAVQSFSLSILTGLSILALAGALLAAALITGIAGLLISRLRSRKGA